MPSAGLKEASWKGLLTEIKGESRCIFSLVEIQKGLWLSSVSGSSHLQHQRPSALIGAAELQFGSTSDPEHLPQVSTCTCSLPALGSACLDGCDEVCSLALVSVWTQPRYRSLIGICSEFSSGVVNETVVSASICLCPPPNPEKVSLV